MGVTRLLLLGPFYYIQTNFLYFFAHDCMFLLIVKKNHKNPESVVGSGEQNITPEQSIGPMLIFWNMFSSCKARAKIWTASYTNAVVVSKLPSLMSDRISNRMSFEELAIFFANLAYMGHIRQIHPTYLHISNKYIELFQLKGPSINYVVSKEGHGGSKIANFT